MEVTTPTYAGVRIKSPVPASVGLTPNGAVTHVVSVRVCVPQPTTTWDAERIYGCVCDSSWTVGWGSGETQVTEWFGPDCSMSAYRTTVCTTVALLCLVLTDHPWFLWPFLASPAERCPSGDDPMTTADETDCEDKMDNGAEYGDGASGNLCHVDCANRGEYLCSAAR